MGVVDKIPPDIIKMAKQKLMPGKNNSVFSFLLSKWLCVTIYKSVYCTQECPCPWQWNQHSASGHLSYDNQWQPWQQFSTSHGPVKCKNNWWYSSRNKEYSRSLLLCETLLPWVNFDNLISNTMDGNQLDIKIKVAKYIDLIATALERHIDWKKVFRTELAVLK